MILRLSLCATVVVLAAVQGHGAVVPREDRELFAEIRAADEKFVEFTLVARLGTGAALTERLRGMGARIVAHYDDIELLVARAPVVAADAIIAAPEVLAWRAEHTIAESNDATPPPLRAGPPVPGATQTGDYALPRLLTGADVIGLPDFWRQHPSFDGRGTRALVQDAFVDPAHPNLQRALDLKGREVRKIAAFLPPTERTPANGWWRARDLGDAAGKPTIELDGRPFRKPGPGPYHYAVLDEEAGGRRGLYAGDFNRDGNPRGSSSRFGVCWDPAQGRAWVDVNQNGDFRDDPPLRSYSETGDVGSAGTDNPMTPVREVNPYFVEFDPAGGFIWVGSFASSYHGTMVAGAMAGAGLLGRDLQAPAPAAQIISQRGGVAQLGPAATIRELHRAFQEDWDVFQSSVAYDDSRRPSPSASARLMEGPNVFVLAFERWLQKSGRTFVYAAGNEFRSLLAKSDSFGPCGLAVGAYLSRDLWSNHLGITPPAQDYVAPAGARGPGLDGSVCPEVLAPTDILTLKPVNFPEERLTGPLVLPNGYVLGGGTSAAAPVASGLALALVSAAKQRGLPHDGARIKRAMIGGARWLEGIPAHEQGNGLLQPDAAWTVLQRLATKEMVIVESSGPIRTADSRDRLTPDRGVGLYEREGWRAGQRERRTLSFRRLSGPSGPQSYRVRLKGNDGTFVVADRVTLPLAQSVELAVDVSPQSSGVHSALLELLDADGDSVHQCMLCIVAAEEFSAAGTLVLEGTVARPSRRSFYVRVPSGVETLVVKQTIRRGDLFFNYYDPVDEQPGYSGLYFSPADPIGSRTFAHPAPGVWEIAVNNERDATRFDPARPALEPGEFRLELFLKTATGTAGSDGTLRVQSVLGAGRQALRGMPLVARRTQRVSLNRGLTGSAIVDFEVPAGATSVTVRAEAPGADLNLYAFARTHPTAPLTWAEEFGPAPEILRLDQPPPGALRVVVDPYALPRDHVEAEVTVEISHPDYGMTSVPNDVAPRAMGAAWDAAYEIRPGQLSMPAGWTPAAYVTIMDADADDHRFFATQRDRYGWIVEGSRHTIVSVPVGNVEVPLDRK